MKPGLDLGTVVLAEPTLLGRYELIYRVGMGAMAAVFLARERAAGGLDRWVAIKRIHPHLGSQKLFTQMLLDEARLAARIAHPNVAQVLDLGEAEGVPYIVMEYLHGQPLSSVIHRGSYVDRPPDVDIMSRIVADAAEGAHAAHELRGGDGAPLGLVHRDLSPHNVFVTYAGAVKVVDFGIAKARGRATLTDPGTVKGKFSYMSPEQACGRALDRRSDVYALGLLLYEATTGRPVFEGTDPEVLALLEDPVVTPPSRHRRGYPGQLEAIVMRSLQKWPEDRFQTAREMAGALERFIVGRRAPTDPAQIAAWMEQLFPRQSRTQVGAPSGRPRADSVDKPSPAETRVATRSRPRRPWVVLATLGALIVVLAIVNWVAWERRAPSPRPGSPIAPRRSVPPERTGHPSTPVVEREPVRHAATGEAPTVASAGPPAKGGGSGRASGPPRPRERSVFSRATGTGMLDVRSVPWSMVTVDGGASQMTPMVGRLLPAGWHTIRLLSEDGRSKRMRVRVSPEETTSIMVRF